MLYDYEAQRTSANPSKSPILIKQRMAKKLKLQYSTYQSHAWVSELKMVRLQKIFPIDFIVYHDISPLSRVRQTHIYNQR